MFEMHPIRYIIKFVIIDFGSTAPKYVNRCGIKISVPPSARNGTIPDRCVQGVPIIDMDNGQIIRTAKNAEVTHNPIKNNLICVSGPGQHKKISLGRILDVDSLKREVIGINVNDSLDIAIRCDIRRIPNNRFSWVRSINSPL
jgi:hypothetical protein